MADAIVAAFLIDLEETVEHQNRAVGSQSVSLAVGAFDLDLGNRLFQIGRGHLAGDGALPDQIIEAQPGPDRDACGPVLRVRRGSVGRIASCASWVFFALVLYSRAKGV